MGPDSLMFGPLSAAATDLKSFHPPLWAIHTLLNLYMENVNALLKVLHGPTLRKQFHAATKDFDAVNKTTEALMFSVYLAAVNSLNEESCRTMFGESQATLFSRYKSAAECALASSRLLGTLDFTLLQAFVVYIVRQSHIFIRPLLTIPLTFLHIALSNTHDPRTLWNLAGMAMRIAQGQGLHRDGTVFSLSPFETEMRRRLWYE